ncbi:unnamed protein product, partial [Nesidiocoris tenuis]
MRSVSTWIDKSTSNLLFRPTNGKNRISRILSGENKFSSLEKRGTCLSTRIMDPPLPHPLAELEEH